MAIPSSDHCAAIKREQNNISSEKLRARDIDQRRILTAEQTRIRAEFDRFSRRVNGLRQRYDELETDARIIGCLSL